MGERQEKDKSRFVPRGAEGLLEGWAAAHRATCVDGDLTGGTWKPDAEGASPYSAEKHLKALISSC